MLAGLTYLLNLTENIMEVYIQQEKLSINNLIYQNISNLTKYLHEKQAAISSSLVVAPPTMLDNVN